ncbi:hypothetical protein [Cellvibrio sp. QJXJ]|uniref:hypothetical protein n=1 Tax=Cellvibrio sp. QJXJ TaxID=2964606 RepID=UPI0021C31FBA|nr:hypothetical protein [Cellvibrio sp. QJXJ]UUA75146.1 hypothetical protein NNX04_22070 [Cellvibrio sp. QJXJ]
MRDTLVLLHDKARNKIHFASTSLRGNDHWIDFRGDNDDLFILVEDLMVENGIANNVTSIQYLRTCGKNIEYTVTYNKMVPRPTFTLLPEAHAAD